MCALFSANIRVVKPNNPWSDPKAPPPELNLPVSMGPISLPNLPNLSYPSQVPESKPKRRWRWLVVWTFFVFAGGIGAGPFLTDQAYVLVERVAPMLGLSVPPFAENHRPAPPPVRPVSPQVKAIAPVITPASGLAAGEPKAPTAEAPGEPTPAAVKPVPSAVERRTGPVVVPTPTAEVVVPVRHAPVAARAEGAVAEASVARSRHTKGAVRASSSTRRASGSDDPFATEDEFEKAPRAAAPSGKPRPSPSEPAAKTKAAQSSDPLDNLMADGVTGGKGKKRENKDLDALLKDVQKSQPEPPPKREVPPPAASLSPADISRVMAGVKTRGNECAERLGQKGIAELKITVGKDGHVTNVHVGGKVAGTPLAACVEKATRAATFPASSGLRFDYRIDCR